MMIEIGSLIKAKRIKDRLTVEKLAEKTNLSTNTITNLEESGRLVGGELALLKIVNCLGLKLTVVEL
jgi:transcriptional regulator with XRE-family HTH domain